MRYVRVCLILHVLISRKGVNCAGEIRVAEEEDYENWAIEIFVKFREGEPLTLLTGQRQSGGVSQSVLMK